MDETLPLDRSKVFLIFADPVFGSAKVKRPPPFGRYKFSESEIRGRDP
jgi:hypothetical protein